MHFLFLVSKCFGIVFFLNILNCCPKYFNFICLILHLLVYFPPPPPAAYFFASTSRGQTCRIQKDALRSLIASVYYNLCNCCGIINGKYSEVIFPHFK
jgi:hypothetical protein